MTRLGFAATTAYAWLAAVLLGITVLDVVEARRLAGVGRDPQTADLLLLMTAATLAAGILAAILSDRARARALVLASVAIGVAAVIMPAVLGSWLEPGAAIGAVLRLAVVGSASVLAAGAAASFQRTG
jgi:hypothetical protein